MNFFNF